MFKMIFVLLGKMGRPSPSKSNIFIDCSSTPELYERFYRLKKLTAKHVKRSFPNNRSFMDFLLTLLEEKLSEYERRSIVKSY